MNLQMKPESIQFIFANRLLNNFHIADQIQIISETIRVLAIGGISRLGEMNATVYDNSWPIFAIYNKAIEDFVTENYHGKVKVRIHRQVVYLEKV